MYGSTQLFHDGCFVSLLTLMVEFRAFQVTIHRATHLCRDVGWRSYMVLRILSGQWGSYHVRFYVDHS